MYGNDFFHRITHNRDKVVGDDTTAIESVLKADVWRDSLMREEASLNAKIVELEDKGDEKRFEDAREELTARLTEVHTSLAEIEAESGPARAATLLAGTISHDYRFFCFFTAFRSWL